jgi:hypothetical protein
MDVSTPMSTLVDETYGRVLGVRFQRKDRMAWAVHGELAAVVVYRRDVRKGADVRRYSVSLADGTESVVAADRHRRDGTSEVFEIQVYDDSLPVDQRWRTVSAWNADEIQAVRTM